MDFNVDYDGVVSRSLRRVPARNKVARRQTNAMSLQYLAIMFYNDIKLRLFAIGQWQSFDGLDRRQILFTASFARLIHALSIIYATTLRSRYFRLKLSPSHRICRNRKQSARYLLTGRALIPRYRNDRGNRCVPIDKLRRRVCNCYQQI